MCMHNFLMVRPALHSMGAMLTLKRWIINKINGQLFLRSNPFPFAHMCECVCASDFIVRSVSKHFARATTLATRSHIESTTSESKCVCWQFLWHFLFIDGTVRNISQQQILVDFFSPNFQLGMSFSRSTRGRLVCFAFVVLRAKTSSGIRIPTKTKSYFLLSFMLWNRSAFKFIHKNTNFYDFELNFNAFILPSINLLCCVLWACGHLTRE